jgi:hypothetical protein
MTKRNAKGMMKNRINQNVPGVAKVQKALGLLFQSSKIVSLSVTLSNA